MSDITETSQRISQADKADHLMTVISGWGSVVLFILAIHRWVASSFDWWARAGLILAFGLFIMWVWGYWPQIVSRVKGWARGGGLNTTLVAAGLVIALILVNAMVRRRLQWKFDLTKNQRFTLAPRTREILKNLKGPVKVTAFIPAGRTSSRAKDTFRQYADASDKFQWTQVDPLVDQQKVMAFNPPPKLDGSTLSGAVLEYGGKRQDITEFTEKDVTSAILKLTRDKQRTVDFLSGHGEPDTSPSAAASDATRGIQTVLTDLKDTEAQVQSLDLYRKTATAPDPDQVSALVIAGPEKALSADEQKRVNEYLNKGGHVLLLLNRRGPSFSEFLKPWGIQTGDDLVLEPREGGLVLTSAEANAPAAVRAGKRVLFRPLRSVTALKPAPAGITVTELLKSGEAAIHIPHYVDGKTNLQAALNTGTQGAVSLIAMAEKKIGTGDQAKTARLIVVGDSEFMTDQFARLPSIYNADLAAGMINYLAEDEALVDIAPKDQNTEQAFLTPEQSRVLPLIHLLDFPLLALLLAIVVYVKRR